MEVTKRNGRREKLDIKKIQAQTAPAVAGLPGTSQSELEVDAQIQFRDGVTTEEIQLTLIKTAVDKIDIDRPNWTFVAARLFLYDLYHKVSGFSGYIHLKEYIEHGIQAGRLLHTLSDGYDLDDLNAYIKPERDMQFTYLGIRTLYDRYIVKDSDGNPIELPQHLFMAVAMFLAQNEENKQEWAKKFYDVMSKFEVMVATPTLSNARTYRHQLSSCYIGSTPDNIEGIFDSYKEMALLSKYGGGIGWDWSKVRGAGSYIDGHKDVAGGVVPFLKMANDVAIAVDQLGTRKGSIAVYIEPWHIDIKEFLDLKKNSGEERRRAHDLFPALWINDLFMERVAEDGEWTLFDPYEVSDLTDTYGEEWRTLYEAYEQSTSIRKEVVSAKALWKDVLRSYYETGSPFLTFKDTANKANPNSHSGIIRSSNLCTEIYQNTEPTAYFVKVQFEDGTEAVYDEEEMVQLDDGSTIQAKKITSLHSINGVKVYITERTGVGGNTAVCNLASVNLSKVRTPEDMDRVVPIAVRMLDNVIDLNFYPHKKVKDTNMRNRAIGLGVMGEAELLATSQIHFGTHAHLHLIDQLMEAFSYNAIRTSALLAEEKGSYEDFILSNWYHGITPIDKANPKASNLINRDRSYDWDNLREMTKKGMRNGYLMAIAPTSSISILTGTSQAIEPVYKRKWFEENISGLIPVTAPKLSPDTWAYYMTAYEVDQLDIVRAGAIRQKWIDQGQSLNIFVSPQNASGRYLNGIYSLAWELGLKGTYYLRSTSPEANNDIEDRSQECVGCQ